MYIYTHIHICENHFTNITILKIGIGIESHFLEWRLMHLGKELFKC